MRMHALALLLIVALLAGCDGQAVPTETPALPPLADSTPEASPASTSEPVLLDRPTLPPTWTPDLQPTPTLTPFLTLTPDGTLDALRALPTFPACGGFLVDFGRTAQVYTHQQPVTIAWGAAAGADTYRVTLFNTSGQSVFADTTRDTTYTFPGDLFFFGEFYGWEVRPFDSAGIQYCMPIGDDLTGQ